MDKMPIYSRPRKIYCILNKNSAKAYHIPIAELHKEINMIIMTRLRYSTSSDEHLLKSYL